MARRIPKDAMTRALAAAGGAEGGQEEALDLEEGLDLDDLGEDEFELEQDSADEGVWKLALVSAGSADEVREDTLTVRCWDQDGDDDAEAGTSTDDTGE